VNGLGEGFVGSALQPGDHIGVLHFGARQRQDLLVTIIRDGLDAGDRCVCVLRPRDGVAVAARLGAGGEAGHGDRLVLLDGTPDDPAPLGALAVTGRTRLVTDLTWVDQNVGPSAWSGHTAAFEGLAHQGDAVAVCLGDVERFDMAGVVGLCACHPKLFLGRRPVAGLGPNALPARRLDDGVLAVSRLLHLTTEAREVGALTAAVLGSLPDIRLAGMVVGGRGWQLLQEPLRQRRIRAPVETQLRDLGAADGPLSLPDRPWGWAFSLAGPDGTGGHLIVGADAEPAADELFVLGLVARLAGNALTHIRLRERAVALSRDLQRTRAELQDTATLLDWCTVVRDRLHQVVVDRTGPEGIALAIHDMTGHTVEIEDSDGRLWARSGPEPHRTTRPGDDDRRELLQQARRAGEPFMHNDRLVTAARRGDDVVGLLILLDADGELGEGEMLALQDGAALLALELEHVREVAETEVRLGRDVVRELLDGGDPATLLTRGRAVGRDLERPHRIVAVEPSSRPAPDMETFFHAVRRAARDTGAGPLLTLHGRHVVLLANADAGAEIDWDAFRDAVVAEPGGGRCRIGLGARCERGAGVPAALRQARLALRLHAVVGGEDRVVAFERLGIFQLLAEMADTISVERYVNTWLRPLQPLLDYDRHHNSDLVVTLSQFVELGARHDATAKALNVHRSTLKYRLQRIRAVAGWDLADPDTLFNLQLSTRAHRILAELGG
jgi:sugar diacid utilization regulator